MKQTLEDATMLRVRAAGSENDDDERFKASDAAAEGICDADLSAGPRLRG
jgi:hypothetical protein